jgi:signal transduction histidine kinase
MNTSILIVEDEGVIALDMKKKLEHLGYSVPGIVDNGEEALGAVETLRPSLVLMDINIKGSQDGIEVAELIRARFHIPIIFVTGNTERQTLERARLTEPFGYTVKPVRVFDLRPQIEMALWKHAMESRLRASEAWLSATFRNVADALIATDSEGNVAMMNALAEGLTGWKSVEAKGRPLLDIFQVFDAVTDLPLVHPLETIYDGRDFDLSGLTLKLARRGHEDPERKVMAQAGPKAMTLIEAEISANRDAGSLLGIIVVFRDITELRKAEERNRQLQKMNALALMAVGLGRQLEESQRGMDHSVKELLSMSRGRAVSLVADIYERAAWQQSLVQQLIRMGRTEAGQPTPVNLNQVLTTLDRKLRKIVGLDVILTLRLEPALPLVKADLAELQETLLRLAADARGAMPDGGTLDISTAVVCVEEPEKWQVQLAIRDSGKGLRAGAKERIFDPYYQARPGNRNPGFSMALVYQFVALSGGSIEVESSPVHGTAYLLTFPALQAPDVLCIGTGTAAATA